LEEISEVCATEGMVVQRYLDTPYLIDDLKLDLRIYVLMTCVCPLRIYIHKMGIARFATEEYVKPKASNLENLYMHLTNYAINKNNKNFAQNEEEDEEEVGHKRSLNAILQCIKEDGGDPEKVMAEIKDIIVRTMVIGQPYLSHLYKSCQPEELEGDMCFQVLGFDIMLDD
jgi:tubulin polyglutamylase TTLL6/13